MDEFKNYTKEDYLKLYDKSLDELVEISHKITTENFSNEVEACSIISVKTVELIQKHGIEACCGVIIGMGETREDRIDMALSLKKLNPKTVPINFLNPIKGTPLEDFEDKIDEEEILKTICIFRIILPNALLRYAGGRTTRLSKDNQKLGIVAGVNSVLVGNYLTTTGSDSNEDKEMLKELDLTMV